VQAVVFETISHDTVPPNPQRPNREIQWYIEKYVDTICVLRNRKIGTDMLDHCCLHTEKSDKIALAIHRLNYCMEEQLEDQ